MAYEAYRVSQGGAITIDVVLRDADGVVITAFDGSQPLSTTAWPGGDLAASFEAQTIWTDAANGRVAIIITSAQTAPLPAGTYTLTTWITDGGEPTDCWTGTLSILPAADATPPVIPPTIVSIAEASISVPSFASLVTADQAALVAAATDAINAYCGRVFPLTTHDEIHSPERSRTIRLKQYPVASIERICTGLTTALTVVNPTLRRPTVTLVPATSATAAGATATALKLAGYTAGVKSSTTLNLADSPTLADLAVAINALGSGWSATVADDLADLPTTDLNPDWGTRSAIAPGAVLHAYARDLALYELDPSTGTIDLHADYTPGFRYPDRTWAGSGRYGSFRVTYSAGFNNDPDAGTVTMPDALKRAAFALIKILAHKTQLGLKTQEKMGDRFAIVTTQMMSLISDLLDPFRRRRIY